MKTNIWPRVDIFILNTNARDDIRKVLEKLKHLDYPKDRYQITIADNNSTDGSKEMVEKEFPDVQVIPLKKNHGMSGLNFGFKKRKGEFCFILDDDSYFDKKSIKAAIAEFKRDKRLGVLACNILSADGRSEFKYMRQTGWPIDWCDFIGGGSVVRSAVFAKVGYFSPDILIYGHEADFSLRVLNAGYTIRFVPEIIVRRTVLPNKMNNFRMSLGVRNFPTIFWRYLSWPAALAMSMLMWGEYFVIACRTNTLGAFFSGLTNFVKHLPYIKAHRTPVRKRVEAFWLKLYPYSPANIFRRLTGRYYIG